MLLAQPLKSNCFYSKKIIFMTLPIFVTYTILSISDLAGLHFVGKLQNSTYYIDAVGLGQMLANIACSSVVMGFLSAF